MTAGPLALFSAVLLGLGIFVGSWSWIAFASAALTTCLALALYRFRVVIDPTTRSMKRAWCIGVVPLVRREGTLEGYDFVSLAPFSQRGPLDRRSLWQLLEPRYRVSLFGEAGTIPIGAFYRREPAWALAQRAAGALGLDVYDKTVAEAF
jgi:hypothetical protein